MNPTSALRSLALLGSASLLAAPALSAASLFWDGDTGVWGTTTFWSTDPVDTAQDPLATPISTDDVFFSSTSAAAQSIAALNADRAALSVTFNTNFGTILRAQSAATTARKLSVGAGGITVSSASGAVLLNDTPGTYGILTTEIASSQSWTNESSSSLTVAGPVTLGGNTLTLSGTGSGVTTLSGIVSGSGGAVLVDRSGGGVTFSGANTFTGQLTVARGSLSIGTINNVSASGTLGNSALPVILGSSGQAGTLSYTGATATSTKPVSLPTGGTGVIQVTNAANRLTLSGVISGEGGLTKTGPGRLTLDASTTNPNTYTGPTRVLGGVLELGGDWTRADSSISGGYTGTPVTGSNLEINGGVVILRYNMNRALGAGPGQVQITGGRSGFAMATDPRNTWVVGGSTSFEVVWGAAGEGPALGYFNPSVFVMNDSASGVSGEHFILGNPVDLNGASRSVETANSNSASYGEFTRVIRNTSGTAAGLIKLGVGELRLSAANTYNGPTLVSGGTLTIGGGATSGSLSTSSVITTDATLAFNRTDTLTQGTNFASEILGAGGITQAGTGTVVLSGTNSYAGNTRGNAGILFATVPSALPGYDATGKVIFNGGTIAARLGGSNWTTAEVDTLLSNATKTSGALGIDTANGNLTQWAPFLGGANFGGLGLTKLGANTLTLNQANTYTGPTTINAGAVHVGIASVAGVSGALGVNSAVTMANVSGVSLLLNGFSTQVGSLAGGGTTGGSINLGGGDLTIAGTNAGFVSYAGAISGAGNLVKNGAGFQVLGGANNLTYLGTTTINGGMLDFGANSTVPGTGRSITVAAGAAVRFNSLTNTLLSRIVETTGEITVMTGATASGAVDFSSSTGANLPNAFLGNWASNGAKSEYNVVITPAADNFRLGGKFSSGLLGIQSVLSGTQGLIAGAVGATGIRINLVAANTFSGETVINTGTRLTLGNNLALQNSALNVGSAGGNFSCAAGTNAGKIAGETAATSPTFGGLIGSRALLTVFSNSASNNETNLASSAITGFTLNPGEGKSHTYSGIIANFAPGTTLVKTGAGTQTLTGASTYSGGTSISAGTLVVGSAGALGTGSVTVNGGTLRLDAVPTSGTVNVNSGATVLFGVDASAAPIVINTGGTLNLGGQTLATAMTVGAGSTLTGTGTFVSATNTISCDIRPGNGTGSLTITNPNLTLGGPVHLEIGGTAGGSFDVVVGGGNITAVGDINLSFVNGFVPTAGNSWDFFTEDGTFTSSADLNLPSLPEGLGWNTSTFATTGSVSVVATIPPLSAMASVSTFSETAAFPASVVTVSVPVAPVANLVVTISADDTEVSVPATVTILAGNTSANFNVAAVNDGIADGNQVVAIGLTAAGYLASSVNVTVTDVGVADPVAAYVSGPPYNLTGNDALPGADPDGDGLSNTLEYALGTSPIANNGPEYRGIASTTPAGSLTLTYRRPFSAVPGVTYGVEFKSADLVVGNTGWTLGVLDTDYTETLGPDLGDGTRMVTITLTGPVSGKKFARLAVTIL